VLGIFGLMLRILSCILWACTCPFILNGQNATEIVTRADKHMRGNTSYAEFHVKIVRPKWTREMDLKSWSKGKDLAMILITAPVRDYGVVYLKRNKEVWNYIPSIERNIKLPPSMMSQSWMGTDFTNDDLVKEASLVEDYNHVLMGVDTVIGLNCYRIELYPKPKTAVIWGKIVLWVDCKNDMLMRACYYDEEGVLINILSCSEVVKLGGRMLPSKMEMQPVDDPGFKTILIYRKIEFDLPLEADFFSVNHMPTLK
jgi:outer membrane lipoprotein-sorting protein